MPTIKLLTLNPEQRKALEQGALYHAAPSFRLRCQAILLKNQDDMPRTSAQVASELGCCEMSVNDWIKRFETEGMVGLKVKSGRGRPGLLQADDLETISKLMSLPVSLLCRHV